ncbi:hypothetical protein RND81_04G047700 [Saponaria officinalis]|uniref:Reverse transcriptase domain-containing protein n=1 Tax=Saponaria officinalis TaxID=3572 RepID=A0AAW1LIZ4_SAPOF
MVRKRRGHPQPKTPANTHSNHKNTNTNQSKSIPQNNISHNNNNNSHNTNLQDNLNRNSIGVPDGVSEPIQPLDLSVLDVAQELDGDEQVEDGVAGWQQVGQRSPVSSPKAHVLQLSSEDVSEEIAYWSSAIVCFILGVNPPSQVLTGFIKRIWDKHEYDKLVLLPNGVFIVRFKSKEVQEQVLRMGYQLFDSKPLIIKPWSDECKLVKEEVKAVPTWVRLHGLVIKFWGEACLRRFDATTDLRTRLVFARYLVEVQLGQVLPNEVEFIDEKGCEQCVHIEYEWKLVICDHCRAYGHEKANCMKLKTQPARVWRPVVRLVQEPPVVPTMPVVPTVPVVVEQSVDHEQCVDKGISATNKGKEVVQATPISGSSSRSSATGKALAKNKVYESFKSGWSLVTNIDQHPGGRIWVLWRAAEYDVTVLNREAQFIHCYCTGVTTKFSFWFTVVYGFNGLAERNSLWLDLEVLVPAESWVIAGDINNILLSTERIGAPVHFYEFSRFQRCVNNCGLRDLKAIGQFFTWNNKQEGTQKYPDSYAEFLPEGTYDHSPCIIHWGGCEQTKRAPFRFFTMWTLHPNYEAVVQRQWAIDVPDKRPCDVQLQQLERQLVGLCNQLQQAKWAFLRQKSKVEWLCNTDENTAYFHGCIKERRSHNKVLRISDMHGNMCDDEGAIEAGLLEFYKHLLGSSKPVERVNGAVVRSGRRIQEHHLDLLLKPITFNEVGEAIFSIPDVNFFKASWNLRPTSVLEFRPIACCNVVYKCIAKLLCNRVGASAFIKGRSILDNVLICQDLVRLYHRKSCSPRCIMKIDLKKAYDSALGFPTNIVGLLMECVSSPSYSLMRGLRQGDPLSPLLFTICMDYLSRILNVKLRLNHLCFADDLVMFFKGHVPSMELLLQGFLAFSKASGLEINASKSAVYVNGLDGTVARTLPFKYLGIPISPMRLSVVECNTLVEKMTGRIRGWQVQSVLSTVHSYWANIFILPVKVIKRIEQVCRSFLWSGMETNSRIPQKNGGLGLKNIRLWNVAKADHLWVQWVHHVYLRGGEWLDYHPPLDKLKMGLMQHSWGVRATTYKVNECYNWLQGDVCKKDWAPMICWLGVNGRLLTKQRLNSFGMTVDDACFLCVQGHDECVALNAEWLVCNRDRRLPLLCRQMRMAVVYALIYYVWKGRNVARIHGFVPHPMSTLNAIKWDLRCRVRR